MLQIRYLAILSEDPAALAGFYRNAFGMRELAVSPSGDVSITDGWLNLTVFRIRPELGEVRMEPGLHHIGVAVEDIEQVKARFRKRCPRGVMVPEPGGAHYGDLRLYDPECIPVSLSRRSFGLGSETQAQPCIGHIGFDALDPDAMIDFYADVFGFTGMGNRDRGGDSARPDRFANDGRISLEIHCYFGKRTGYSARYGINHLGLLAHDAAKVAEGCRNAFPLVSGNTMDETYAVDDSDGNRLHVARSRGIEVDLGRWIRAA